MASTFVALICGLDLLLSFLRCSSATGFLIYSATNVKNLYAIDTKNGEIMSEILLDTNSISNHDITFRGLAFYNGQLYVGSAKNNNSFIGSWQCNSESSVIKHGMKFNGYFTKYDISSNSGLFNPYGISVYLSENVKNGFLYASAYDTQSLLLYDSNGNPDDSITKESEYPGAIKTYGKFNETNNLGIRSIEIDTDNGLLFVAIETFNQILVYDINNDFKNIFNITNGDSTFKPLYMTYNGTMYKNILFVTDDGKDYVYAFEIDPNNNEYSLKWTSEKTGQLTQPAGIAIAPNGVYVVSRGEFKIVEFDPDTGDYNRQLIYFDGDPQGDTLLYIDSSECFW